jgi:hypothetical protein
MIANRKVCVVVPASNAGRTLQARFRAIPTDVVDDVILVDDASTDDIAAVARTGGTAVGHNRGFKRSVIEGLPLERDSDDFVFDNRMLTQALYKGFLVGEISCPTSYFSEPSSISVRRGVIYALGVLRTGVSFRLACLDFDRGTIFEGTAADTSLMAPA